MRKFILKALAFIEDLITKTIYLLFLIMTLLGAMWMFRTFAIPYLETLINIKN